MTNDSGIRIFYPNAIKIEEDWKLWFELKGKGMLQLPLPPSALINSSYFFDFVYDYADRYPIEPFSIDSLTDGQALQLLCILESYFFDFAFQGEGWLGDDRSDAVLYRDVRKKFDL
jgi:hypothetical protein